MRLTPAGILLWLLVLVLVPPLGAGRVDFSREVRPILSRHCFKCHGPDEKARKAKLRLDVREAATRPSRSETRPIVPGKPAESELVRRIRATEPDEVMPPPATQNPLTDAEKQLLGRWIAEGAVYQQHWAFVPPRQSLLPRVRQTEWPRNAIDYFVLARLEGVGLKPSPRADRATLVRRLSLDLIGLPPTPEEVDAFVRDDAPNAYDKLVDRLLASPHYGERWARRWLDLARYADTNGYEKDRVRSIWPYRDWVIGALNADLPFDRFTVEQLAGDLLNPSSPVATGFHRNTMLNEEGGIDPLEFRFHAVVDRANTTATAWLGLTMGCAQCHTHKFDPISQREYYQFLAFLNNADEPEIEVPRPNLTARRAAIEAEAAARTADLAKRFPPEKQFIWQSVRPTEAKSAAGATMELLADSSVRVTGKNPERDTYTVVLDSTATEVAGLRIEALTDPSCSHGGPGRSGNGNFVLSEVAVTVSPLTPSTAKEEGSRAVRLAHATADFEQHGFPAAHAIDGNRETGWAIYGPGNVNVPRTLTLSLEKPVTLQNSARWTIRLEQQHGSQHTLGRFRIALGRKVHDPRPLDVRRREHLEWKFANWLRQEEARAVRWEVLRPIEAKANVPLLTILGDSSVLASGDMSKRDVYDLRFQTNLRGIRALRLETLPHESLPAHGPGRVFYEGPPGDFYLSELTLTTDKPVKFSRATQSYTQNPLGASDAIDGKPETGWSIRGGQGKANAAMFTLAEPLGEVKTLSLQLLFERYYAAGLGRFRVSVTNDSRPAEARGLPADVEDLLLIPSALRTAAQRQRLLDYYLSVAPELTAEREAIEKLRMRAPAYPTTLVLTERPPENPRPTYVHRRGEYLQPAERVDADVPAILPPLPRDVRHDRLALARWLVDPGNPLTGRVTMNRQWPAFFGRGIVRTLQDFGYQGEPPTHPELLDWLAVELMRQGWSMKRMHRLIVSSATYQQSSRVTPELLARDPDNALLARGPRFRIEAELVRDLALRSSGLLSERIGGPSVFPPQPPGVTSEGAYVPLDWKVSTGPDRYRRGLYTFSKRTAPYAAFVAFDAPSGEACTARREVANTPLQALTLLNDEVFMEAARALGNQTSRQPGTTAERVIYLFRCCLSRRPERDEVEQLVRFQEAQKQRFLRKELDPAAVAGPGAGDACERATWTAVARVLLNLDETITKE
jgi:hypothetical protein